MNWDDPIEFPPERQYAWRMAIPNAMDTMLRGVVSYLLRGIDDGSVGDLTMRACAFRLMRIARPDPAHVERNVETLRERHDGPVGTFDDAAVRALLQGVALLRWIPSQIAVTVYGTDEEIADEAYVFAALMATGMTDGFERPQMYKWIHDGRPR